MRVSVAGGATNQPEASVLEQRVTVGAALVGELGESRTERVFATIGADSGGGGTLARIDVRADGAVVLAEGSPDSFDGYLSLEGISFRAGG